MNVINTLIKICDCLFWPLFCYFAGTALFLLSRKNNFRFILFAVLIVMISWRSFFLLTSSRYCASFILLSFITIGVFFVSAAHNGIKYHIFVVFAIILLQTIKCYSGHRDVYIYDIKDEISALSPQSDSAFLIYNKETTRISASCDIEEDPIILGAGSIYEITKEKKDNGKYLGSFFINKQKTKRAYIKIRKKETSVIAVAPPALDSLIINGDIEKQYDNKSNIPPIVHRLIREGATIYSSKEIILPQFQELLPSVYHDGYPIIFADPTDAIDGLYSLNVENYKDGCVFFFNRFENSPGQLSFYIKNLNGISSVVLGHNDFEEGQYGRKIRSKVDKTIYLFDNKVHHVSIPFVSSDYAGPVSLFFLLSNKSHFLLDNICYTTSK